MEQGDSGANGIPFTVSDTLTSRHRYGRVTIAKEVRTFYVETDYPPGPNRPFGNNYQPEDEDSVSRTLTIN